jgi:hypothetical protein
MASQSSRSHGMPKPWPSPICWSGRGQSRNRSGQRLWAARSARPCLPDVATTRTPIVERYCLRLNIFWMPEATYCARKWRDARTSGSAHICGLLMDSPLSLLAAEVAHNRTAFASYHASMPSFDRQPLGPNQIYFGRASSAGVIGTTTPTNALTKLEAICAQSSE